MPRNSERVSFEKPAMVDGYFDKDWQDYFVKVPGGSGAYERANAEQRAYLKSLEGRPNASVREATEDQAFGMQTIEQRLAQRAAEQPQSVVMQQHFETYQPPVAKHAPDLTNPKHQELARAAFERRLQASVAEQEAAKAETNLAQGEEVLNFVLGVGNAKPVRNESSAPVYVEQTPAAPIRTISGTRPLAPQQSVEQALALVDEPETPLEVIGKQRRFTRKQKFGAGALGIVMLGVAGFTVGPSLFHNSQPTKSNKSVAKTVSTPSASTKVIPALTAAELTSAIGGCLDSEGAGTPLASYTETSVTPIDWPIGATETLSFTPKGANASVTPVVSLEGQVNVAACDTTANTDSAITLKGAEATVDMGKFTPQIYAYMAAHEATISIPAATKGDIYAPAAVLQGLETANLITAAQGAATLKAYTLPANVNAEGAEAQAQVAQVLALPSNGYEEQIVANMPAEIEAAINAKAAALAKAGLAPTETLTYKIVGQSPALVNKNSAPQTSKVFTAGATTINTFAGK